MGSNQLDVQWTNAILLNVVENYVSRANFSRFTDGERFGDLKSKEVFNSKQALKIIKKLYEKDDGRLSVYGPADQLMEDLITIQYFPNNAKFLGLPDEYNYLGYPRYLVDRSGGEFMSKMDVFMMIYRNHTNAYDDGNEIANLILMKWGNQIGSKLKTSFEIIPGILVDAVVSACSDFYKNHGQQIANRTIRQTVRYSKYNVDELYARFSKHFDESTDAHLLKQLKQQLTAYSKRVPIKDNLQFYEKVYINMVLYEESTKHLLKQFPTIFTPNSPCFGGYNVAATRMLKDGDDAFFFAKELKEALKAGFIDKYEDRKMPKDNILVESDEERNNKGIIYTYPADDYETLLNKFKISYKDVSVIENDYKKTSRQIGVPLISPYGSHCKTATDAFFEVFDTISTGMKVFQGVSSENLPKVFEFFDKLPFISTIHEGKYLVTTAKIDECVEMAYKQLQQYVTEPIYELPKDKLMFTEDEAREEINKLSPNVPLNQENLKCILFYRMKKVGGDLKIRDVYEVYEHCLRLQFFLLNPKFAEFMHNQRACQVYQRFECHCFSKAGKNKAPKAIRMLENLTASHVQAIDIKYNNSLRYYVYTNSGKKFYDNETLLQKALDISLESVRGENRELITYIYEAQNIKLASEAKRFFYLTELETDGLVGQFAYRFMTGIKFSNDRLENQKDDLHQTTDIRWEEINKSLRDFFPEQTKYEELFEKIKANLKKRKCAKEIGIRGNYVAAIMDILRQAQMNFGRIWNTLKSLTDFHCRNPDRTIRLRIMTAIRVDDQKTWHLFTEEVLEALKCVLRAEKRLHLVREKIENWEMEWFDLKTYTTIDVEEFEKILEILHIDKSKFVLVPDAQVIRQFTEIPLKMSYNCMEIVGPDGIMVCHWMQAQYLLFQHLAADVNCSQHGRIRKELMVVIKSMENRSGYISLEELEIIIKNFKTEKSIYLKKVNLETPLTIIHNNRFNEMIPKTFFMDMIQIITEEYFLEQPSGEFEFLARIFFNWLKIEESLKEIESWKARYVLMNYWISRFFGDKEKDTRCNVLFAFTVSLPFVKLPNAKTLKMWKVSILEGENCCVEYARMTQCVENMKTCQKTNKNFKWTDLVRIHEKGASFIASNPRKEAMMKKLIEDKDKKTTEEVLNKIVENFTKKVLPFIEEGEFRKIGKLEELIRKKMKDEMDKDYMDGFEEIMKSCKGMAKLEEKLGMFLDFKIENYEHFYKIKELENERELNSAKTV